MAAQYFTTIQKTIDIDVSILFFSFYYSTPDNFKINYLADEMTLELEYCVS